MSVIRLSIETAPVILLSEYKIFTEDELHISRYFDRYVMIFMDKGTLYFTENGKEVVLNPGEFYFQKKFIYQSATIKSPDAKYYFIEFTALECKENETGTVIPLHFHFDKATFFPLLEKLVTLSKALPFSFLDSQIAFYKILGKLSGSKDFDENIINKTIEFLHKNFNKKITYATLCDEFMYSESHLKRIFKKTTGISPHAYLNTIRLNQAHNEVISSTKSFSDIATHCGFADFTTFFRLFKSEYGVSPSEYRKKHITE